MNNSIIKGNRKNKISHYYLTAAAWKGHAKLTDFFIPPEGGVEEEVYWKRSAFLSKLFIKSESVWFYASSPPTELWNDGSWEGVRVRRGWREAPPLRLNWSCSLSEALSWLHPCRSSAVDQYLCWWGRPRLGGWTFWRRKPFCPSRFRWRSDHFFPTACHFEILLTSAWTCFLFSSPTSLPPFISSFKLMTPICCAPDE